MRRLTAYWDKVVDPQEEWYLILGKQESQRIPSYFFGGKREEESGDNKLNTTHIISCLDAYGFNKAAIVELIISIESVFRP